MEETLEIDGMRLNIKEITIASSTALRHCLHGIWSFFGDCGRVVRMLDIPGLDPRMKEIEGKLLLCPSWKRWLGIFLEAAMR